MTHAVWEENAQLPHFEKLHGDIKTDVLVIGGGLTGILCAHFLRCAGVDTVLVEARRLCGGTTGKTTAKITFQHGLIYADLIRRFGAERAKMYLEANRSALRQYRRLARKIVCDFEDKNFFVYSRENINKIERELEALSQLGMQADLVRKLPLPFSVAGAVGVRQQAQFHPLKFVAGLVDGLRIYEHTEVRELQGLTAVTDHGRIRAEKIIAATHFPFLNKHGSYFLKLYQHRSYVLALKGAADLQEMYTDAAENGLSFRKTGDLLLLGGGSHRTGKSGGDWRELEAFAKVHYPGAEVHCRWATQDCMSLDGVPYIGPYSRNTEGLYVATGFNKWGMTGAMTAAMILSDLVCGRENPYAPAFSPSRSILHPQLAVNCGETILHLLKPTRPRCPHMGCALQWNPQERSWDCSCHGSRFSEKGRLLDTPATGDLPDGN